MPLAGVTVAYLELSVICAACTHLQNSQVRSASVVGEMLTRKGADDSVVFECVVTDCSVML